MSFEYDRIYMNKKRGNLYKIFVKRSGYMRIERKQYLDELIKKNDNVKQVQLFT